MAPYYGLEKFSAAVETLNDHHGPPRDALFDAYQSHLKQVQAEDVPPECRDRLAEIHGSLVEDMTDQKIADLIELIRDVTIDLDLSLGSVVEDVQFYHPTVAPNFHEMRALTSWFRHALTSWLRIVLVVGLVGLLLWLGLT